jgi:hypothetical protein
MMENSIEVSDDGATTIMIVVVAFCCLEMQFGGIRHITGYGGYYGLGVGLFLKKSNVVKKYETPSIKLYRPEGTTKGDALCINYN